MKKLNTATMIKKIKLHQSGIAKHRDALRELISDAEAIADTASDAIESLRYAVDALSTYQ